ncbi:ribosomal protein L14E/L6E/L27E [Aequitasia blattaphilus]|uniref:KOW domain-containing RNA-binding protein n=1 Tax=Aequitasia blattaphilus TaxID=2949332 RepID=A0ABT1EAR2_9FIRM|nr:KOW domain-containing RNA-binding protein [Aequitasia blattaphilus]MCP1102928.1 KOW domain-containing RNA-binding protein [Aequitasia blattaphilus]MCR8615568.1 KOW domain-containing RNA-binding protein [Aequitasia blattaphilus]
MDVFKIGMLVYSKAGHDAGEAYLICEIEDEYLYLVDGQKKTLDKPKKKKKRHVQRTNSIYDIQTSDDVAIKRVIKEALLGENKEDAYV